MGKKKLYLVFGTANKGKSSLIRCLTGIFRGKSTRVQREDDEIGIEVLVSSAQEKWISIEDLIEIIEKSNDDYLLISIRIDSITNKHGDVFPEGDEYLKELKKRYDIIGAAIFGDIKYDIDEKLVARIKEPRKKAPNSDAAFVRKFWGWQ
ncbi:hypothetical protein [Pseudofulvibacter geojedonensis]|uniref:G domain-containing protein n=1 Tax=Pseudofulvibacter geojedonensis TaxID=1123758 RepID=A0ABW3I067_9FLAO